MTGTKTPKNIKYQSCETFTAVCSFSAAFFVQLISFSRSPRSCDPVLGPAAAVWHFSSPESQYLIHLNDVSFKTDCEVICERARNLREVHGVSGPVVHQLVEVIGEGSFSLVGD